MLARRLASILPPLAHDEALEVTRIHSAAGYAPHAGLAQVRPFRMPHHTASTPALVGGGSGRPHPGEVTMAHRGVLVLDELGEWAPRSLDALRQPLEDGRVQIARQRVSMSFPAEFMLVACSNPCPCGLGPPTCRCNEAMRLRYRQRMSAPLLDRFDLRVVVTPPQPDDEPGECSDVVRARVIDAVARQQRPPERHAVASQCAHTRGSARAARSTHAEHGDVMARHHAAPGPDWARSGAHSARRSDHRRPRVLRCHRGRTSPPGS